MRLAHLFRGDATKISGQSDFREGPDDPLCRIEFPRLHSVAVVVLKFVVIIMVAFAESEEREEVGIAGAAAVGIRLPAEGVAGAVDEKGAMLEDGHARHAGDEKSAECADRSVPEITGKGGEQKGHNHGDEMDVTVLPHDEAIAFQISHIIEGRFGAHFEKKPTDVGVEKAL